MVPRGQGKDKGGRANKERKSRATAKGKKAKHAVDGATEAARKRARHLVDPNIAIVAKDPLRVHIIAIALQRLYSPCEFARETGCTLGAAAYHFKVLWEHGFLELVELVPVRGAQKHMYRATKNAYISTSDWGQVSQALRPGIAGAAAQDLETRLTQAFETGTFFKRDDAYLLWDALTLDEVSWPKFVEGMAWAYKEAKDYEVETANRRAKGEVENSIPVTFAIMGFESPTPSQVRALEKRKRKAIKGKPAKRKSAKGRRSSRKRKDQKP